MIRTITTLALVVFLQVNLVATTSGKQRSYFQQEVNTTIRVRLDDKSHSLHAFAEIVYINHSPDTLRELFFHLWPNAYRDRGTALCKQMLESGDGSLYFAKAEDRGFIDSLAFQAEGRMLPWKYDSTHIDICSMQLHRNLLPGDSVRISTPFYVKIPSARISRLGHIGQAYAITQWFPKPAVYDKDGWHAMPYLNQGEFYSEFGSFDVSITLPKNYVVGATGDLQTGSETAWMDERAKLPVDTSDNLDFPASAEEMKTIRFTQQRVHDFAWFADKRFQVLKGEVELPYSKRKVTTWSLFTCNESRLWQRAPEYIADAVYWYSKWVGEYPYNQCTAVDGTISAGGGMEYPNVTIIGSSGSAFPLEVVIAHEVGHNWFYGLLGSNERQHPWMDEGINSFYEMRYVLNKYPPVKYGNWNELIGGPSRLGRLTGLSGLDYRKSTKFAYLASGTSFTEQPVGLPADEYTSTNYGTVVYKKTAVAMDMLAAYLGNPVFDSCMHSYYRNWCFRHPGPDDLRNEFERISGKDLAWFFDGLVHAETGCDVVLRNAEKTSRGYSFRLKERGPVDMPVEVTGFRNGEPVASSWFMSGPTTHTLPCDGCDRIAIGGSGRNMDMNTRNNDSRFILPHFALFPGVHHPERGTTWLTPVAGWNNYDGWMAGMNLYNMGFPYRQIEYSVVPLYSFKSGQLSGLATLEGRRPIKNNWLDRIIWRIDYRQFGFDQIGYKNYNERFKNTLLSYKRLSPEIRFMLRRKPERSSLQHQIKLQSVHLWQQELERPDDSNFPVRRFDYSDFYRITFRSEDTRLLDPWSTDIRLEANRDVVRAEAEWNYRFTYAKTKRGFDIRVYGGLLLMDATDGLYGFNLSDRTRSGPQKDYAFDEFYFGRSESEGFLFSQMALRQGQFKSYTPFGAYKDWILTVNLSSNLPGPLAFLKAYADIGTTADLKRDLEIAYDLKQSLSYNAGLQLTIIPKTIEIYLPLILSAEIRRYEEFRTPEFKDSMSLKRLVERIRFVVDLNRMRPGKLRSSVL